MPGRFVQVPFGRTHILGVVWDTPIDESFPDNKIKPIDKMIDDFHLEYQNVYNFEKYKWGGVRLEQLSYIYFDLREFSKIDFEFNPTKEDINIFNAILERIDSYNIKNDSANKMQNILKDILKSSKAERIILLEILAYLDILEAKEERDYRYTELSEKLMNWRGGDSYNKVNAKNIFGNYLHI